MGEKNKWVVTSAWPYVSGIPHLGNMIGSVLSADVFARYLRLKGDDVVFVSGSDCHGTPIEVEALKREMKPEELAVEVHSKVSELFKLWEISYDNYTLTYNPHHYEFVQDFYMKIYDNGYIFTKEEELTYCPKDEKFLPDRFVEGECPYCHTPGARGDQCDACGKPLEPTQLINPYCVICGTTPITKKTEHWYLDFPKFQEKLKNFIKNNKVIPDNARSWSLSFLEEGLKPRAITRDLSWGIPAPFPEAEEKVIYVWFEAVLGYVSATKEWAEKIIKNPEKWKDYWFDEKTRTLFFIGKDNIVFHLVVFPALLLANGSGHVIPYNVSSTEFLLFEGEKFSKSKGVGVWIDEALELLPVDYWRYLLIATRPETKDYSFTWDELETRINSDLNDVLGNFIHRTLTFISTYFAANVPKRGALDPVDNSLIQKIKETPKIVGKAFENFRFKEACSQALTLARAANAYLNEKAPWHLIKEDEEKAGTVLNLCAQVVSSLAILFAPIIPKVCEKVWKMLGFEGSVHHQSWDSAGELLVKEGQKISTPSLPFNKVDKKELQEKLLKIRSEEKEKKAVKKMKEEIVSIEDFKRLDIRIGVIKKAETVKGTDRLIKFSVDLGEEKERTLVAGLRKWYSPEELVGKQVVVLANLKPAKIKGITSEGMVLAAVSSDEETVRLLIPDKKVPLGSQVL